MDYYIISNTNTFCFPFYFTVSLVHVTTLLTVSFCLCFCVSRYWFLLCLLYFISRTLVFSTLSGFMYDLVYWLELSSKQDVSRANKRQTLHMYSLFHSNFFNKPDMQTKTTKDTYVVNLSSCQKRLVSVQTSVVVNISNSSSSICALFFSRVGLLWMTLVVHNLTSSFILHYS